MHTVKLKNAGSLKFPYYQKISPVQSEDIPGTINFLNSECTEDEYAWISEIIDDLIATTQNKALLECYKQLMLKFPNACSTYNIAYTVECAENALEKRE